MLSKKLITAYDNTGTAVVTRFEDLREVLDRDWDFAVVYEPKMRRITDGVNFFLGMQDTPRYTRDASNMRAAGRIDLPQDPTLRVPAAIAAGYFGMPGPCERDMIAWTTAIRQTSWCWQPTCRPCSIRSR